MAMNEKLNNFGYCKKHNAYFDKDIGYCIFCKTETLEKKYKELEDMQETIVKSDPVKMQGQIVELKEEIKNGDIMVLEPLTKDINKLKERFENYRIINNHDIRNSKEVLRNLFDRIIYISRVYESERHDNFLKELQDWRINLRGLIKKLDSPNQTEKKEPTLQDYFLKQKYHNIEELNKTIKDSGGEKGELEKDLNAIGIYPVKASGGEKARTDLLKIAKDTEKEFREGKLPEPIYLSLKLEKTIDVCGLMENLKYKISRENDITHPSDYNQDHLKKIYKWKDIAKILLRADKSWYKREELYHKYDVIKHKEAEPIEYPEGCEIKITEKFRQQIIKASNDKLIKDFIKDIDAYLEAEIDKSDALYKYWRARKRMWVKRGG